jgi:hypothetical protein
VGLGESPGVCIFQQAVQAMGQGGLYLMDYVLRNVILDHPVMAQGKPLALLYRAIVAAIVSIEG